MPKCLSVISMNSIPELLHKQAENYADKTYLIFKDQEFSYGKIREISQRQAEGLRKKGLQKSDRVALLCPNRPEFIFTYYGAMAAGMVIVPINVLLQGPEVEFIINNCGAKILVYDPVFAPIVSVIQDNCSTLEHKIEIGSPSYQELLAAEEAPFTQVAAEEAAGIIYTSGTTGHPKGVVLTHKNYLVNAQQGVDWCKVTTEDRFICILPLFHANAQLVSTLMPLVAGGAEILMERFNPKTFLSDLFRYKATSFSAVPAMYAAMLQIPDADNYDLSNLRFCICGAAPMPVKVFNAFEEKFNAKILEGYGLSEGTCASSINPLDHKRKVGSIGLPLIGQEIKILDDHDHEVEQGKIGEICIKGENVMKEYFNNPQETAKTIKNGWLHSGDLGYFDTDGYLYIVGRKKEMIIRGGENIYPKEIEEVLYKHDKVAECAVCGVPDSVRGEEVVAFFVTKEEGDEISLKEVREFLKDKLASYKRPRKVFTVAELPKTATGKIQKSKLVESYSDLLEK